MGGVHSAPRSGLPNASTFPTYPLSFHSVAHSFALCKSTTLFFSIVSALFAKNHPGWGYVRPADGNADDCANGTARIHVSLDRTYAPPPDPHRLDFVALPAAP